MVEKVTPSSSPSRSRRRPDGEKKPYVWIAIIVVLIVIIGFLGISDITKPSVSVTPSVIGANGLANVGEPYALSLYSGKFTNATVFFGDNTSKTVNYTGVNGLQVDHTYSAVGLYLIYYTINMGTVYNDSTNLIPVQAVSTVTPAQESQGFDQIIVENSSTMLVNNESDVFSPGANIATIVGYYAAPTNTSYQVYYQQIVLIHNDKYVSSKSIDYSYSNGKYGVVPGQQYYNISDASSGIWTILVNTYTGVVNPNGNINTSVPVEINQYYLDIGVFKDGGLYSAPSVVSTLVDVNQGEGPYKTLDQALASDVVSDQILQNTEQTLVMYNGSSTSQFEPMLASQVPSTSNGGINTNYANYTVKDPWGTTYTVNIKPYENYTFHIRSNASFQNGQKVTAWDAEYSFARALIFIGDSPANTISTFAGLLLPGNSAVTNTFWNITQNMTVDNATNNLTFHFQHPYSPEEVLGLLSGGGNSYIESASWIASEATPQQPALQWSPAGFVAYKPQGNAGDYNINLETNVLSDGPYEISYQIPSSAVVLVKNPYFTAPGSWYPSPTIDKVVVEYVQKTSTRYLDMLSASAQIAGISSTDWNLVQTLESKGIATTVNVPTPGTLWFEFNANVDTGLLDSLYPGANVPSTLFSILPVREAFAYAMNYQYFINDQVGNAIYNANFSELYAGALPAGMQDGQTIAQLNQTTTGVPYYNVTLATQYWKEGVNIYNSYFPSDSSKQITTNSAGDYMYNGKPLTIPIFYQSGFPAYKAAAGTWGTTLSSIIPGSTYPIIEVTIGEEVGYLAYGQNPMPVAWFGWDTSSSYPTSTLLPIGLPATGSEFPAPDAFTPSFFTNSTANPTTNATQAAVMERMIDEYNNGSSALNPSVAKMWFDEMNENLVNMTMYVWMGQSYSTFIVSTHINIRSFDLYNTNPLITSSPDIYFNGVSYT